jgi:hypothetical protein
MAQTVEKAGDLLALLVSIRFYAEGKRLQRRATVVGPAMPAVSGCVRPVDDGVIGVVDSCAGRRRAVCSYKFIADGSLLLQIDGD